MGGVVLAGAGSAVAYELGASGGHAPTGWVLSYRSRPDLSPPRVQMTDVGSTSTPGVFFFVTPNPGPAQHAASQQGLMILSERGAVVWFRQVRAPAFTNLQVQTYRGEPVLTWWQGAYVAAAGFGRGEALIADRSYRTVATVHAAHGLEVDLHEFTLTPQGTALVTAYTTATADLRPVGGPRQGEVFDGVVQEIDVATGRLLFEWHSLDHVGIDETHTRYTDQTFDYFHVNSIGVDPDDDHLIVSARNTWTLYKLDRSSGKVLWRLGGRRSDFTMGAGTRFAWQHHARAHGGGMLTVFDDGASPKVEPQSRAIQLALDPATRTASLTRAFTHPARLLADSQGSFQLLPEGGAIVGWGSEPYFTHFGPDGSLLRDARMPTDQESYRAFRFPWAAAPTTIPEIALHSDNVGGRSVYVSWNGATEVATWEALSGPSPERLSPCGSVPKSGFETAMTVHPTGDFLAMRALDARGRPLATSRTVHL